MIHAPLAQTGQHVVLLPVAAAEAAAAAACGLSTARMTQYRCAVMAASTRSDAPDQAFQSGENQFHQYTAAAWLVRLLTLAVNGSNEVEFALVGSVTSWVMPWDTMYEV